MISQTKKIMLSMFAVLALVLIVSSVSAAPICPGVLCGSVTSTINHASHNSDVTITFDVTYEGAEPDFGVRFSDTSNPTIGTWKKLRAGRTEIGIGKTKSFTATLHIPEH